MYKRMTRLQKKMFIISIILLVVSFFLTMIASLGRFPTGQEMKSIGKALLFLD